MTYTRYFSLAHSLQQLEVGGEKSQRLDWQAVVGVVLIKWRGVSKSFQSFGRQPGSGGVVTELKLKLILCHLPPPAYSITACELILDQASYLSPVSP